ncbi:uncharacterized protein LOC124259143 [Haliotis rubra]|uniref:uncharacterized protein LOC124259143 n=1 Tax=Haliotis rubra TaxID=36100 RepID=UPI001EE5B166|nr:uncharacterized protein LOC124259143 [Haliotis rubra]
MGVRSDVLIVCVVMSIILQMASTDRDGIGKPMDSKLSRKKRAVGSIIAGIAGAIPTVLPFVRDLLSSRRADTEKAVEEMKKAMETEKMTEKLNGRAEMLLAVLQAKMAMDASSATACSCSWLMVSCATFLVAFNLPRHVL